MRENTKLNATKDVSRLKSLLRSWIGFFVKYIGILIAAGVVGILLLTFAYHIPVNQESKESTFEYSEQMGWAPLVNNTIPSTFHSSLPMRSEPWMMPQTGRS